MPNNKFPDTTLQPLQTLDFVLANGKRVRTMLLPVPTSTRTNIADVTIEVTNAGCTLLHRIEHANKPYDMIGASAKAYEHALKEASRVSSQISEVLVEGEEFLGKTDVEQIVGSTITVRII